HELVDDKGDADEKQGREMVLVGKEPGGRRIGQKADEDGGAGRELDEREGHVEQEPEEKEGEQPVELVPVEPAKDEKEDRCRQDEEQRLEGAVPVGAEGEGRRQREPRGPVRCLAQE